MKGVSMVRSEKLDMSGLYRVPRVAKVENLTCEVLQEYLRYDPETGVFTLLKTNSPVYKNRLPYQIPHKKGEYQKVMILNRRWQTHKLAVLLVTGKMPEGLVDHINGDVNDNRWCNLRVLSSGENVRNQSQVKSDTESGVTGVYKRGSKYMAHIRINKKLHYLGQFESLEKAVEVRTRALQDFLKDNNLDIATAQCVTTQPRT
jgi:hypothetical protein